jgi:hypothetical protein
VPAVFVPGSTLTFPDYDTLLHPPAGQTGVTSTVTVTYSDKGCGLDLAESNQLYVFDNQHIRICQNTCQRLVQSIKDDELITAQRNQGRVTPLPQLPLDVSWSYPCDNIPDAGVLVESGSGPNIVPEAGADASEDGGIEDGGAEDAGPG